MWIKIQIKEYKLENTNLKIQLGLQIIQQQVWIKRH